MATITVRVAGLGEFDGEHTGKLPPELLPLLRFTGEQADVGAPWRTLAEALAVLAVSGAQHYMLDYAKRAIANTAAQLATGRKAR